MNEDERKKLEEITRSLCEQSFWFGVAFGMAVIMVVIFLDRMLQ